MAPVNLMLRPGKKDPTLADDSFKCISLTEKFWILNKILLKYIPYGLIDNIGSVR